MCRSIKFGNCFDCTTVSAYNCLAFTFNVRGGMSSEFNAIFNKIELPLLYVAVVFAARYISKSRLKQQSKSRENLMRMPASILVLGIVCFAFFVGLAIVSQVYPDADANGVVKADWWLVPIFVAFSLLGLPLIRSYYVEKHFIEQEGLRYNTLTKRGFLRYDDIVSVDFSLAMNWFVVKDGRGNVVHIASTLTNLPMFARVILQKVDKTRICGRALSVLSSTAEGNPPSLFG